MSLFNLLTWTWTQTYADRFKLKIISTLIWSVWTAGLVAVEEKNEDGS